MADLQCPAVVLLVGRDVLVSGECARELATRHLAGVFVAGPPAADPDVLAAATDLAHRAACRIDLLAEALDGPTLARAIDDLADLHRGETIAIVASAGAIRDALGLARAPADPVTVTIDGSGWSVVRVHT